MFEAACFRAGTTPGEEIDVGFLAEALVFYGQIHYTNHPVALLKHVGPYETLELVKRGHLRIYEAPHEITALSASIRSARERHSFAYVEMPDFDFRAHLRDEFIKAAGGASHTRAAKEFVSLLHIVKRKEIDVDSLTLAALEPEFGRLLVAWLNRLVPGTLPADARIETWRLGNEFQIAANFSMEAVSNALSVRTGVSGYEMSFPHCLRTMRPLRSMRIIQPT